MEFKDLTGDFSKVTEVELVYRNKVRPSSRRKIKSSMDAFSVLKQTWDFDKIELQEQFRVLLLDHACGCLGVSTASSGGMNMCVADPKIIFAMALKAGASSIILAHNHPSGSLKSSKADEALTERFFYAGRILDIAVLDHIILSNEGYFSFADEGLILQGMEHHQPVSIATSHLKASNKGGL